MCSFFVLFLLLSSSQRRSKHPVRPHPFPTEGRHSSPLGTRPGLSGNRRYCVGRFRTASSRTEPSSASLCRHTRESTCGAALFGAPPPPSFPLPLFRPHYNYYALLPTALHAEFKSHNQQSPYLPGSLHFCVAPNGSSSNYLCWKRE